MNENQMKVIVDSLAEASKLGTTNALMYVQKGLEAYKALKIPIVSNDGNYCYGERIPYKSDKGVATFVDFMLVYLDEAIKTLDKKDKSE